MTESSSSPRGAPASPRGGLSPARLAIAPHRLMFFAGATNVLLAMTWWAAWLMGLRWPGLDLVPYPPVFPGWLHAFVMQYQMLPSFIFGFLLTTFPKWTKQPELARWRFIPVGVAMIAGQLATLAGALGSHAAIEAGVALTIIGWTAALGALVPMLWRETGTTWHARACVAALALGYAGLLAFGAFVRGGSMTWVPVSITLGTFGLLLPIYLTITHRMFPFFAGNVVAGYQPWRPLWLLAASWTAVLLRLALALAHADAWLWVGDVGLCGLATLACWRWWPGGPRPGLLTVLFLGLAWLPIATALYAIDDVAVAATGAHLLGRAPAHALFVGFFGSVLVAMVTRVTQGHSGRSLVMPAIAWFTFVALQLVVVARVVSELVADPATWLVIAAVGWLLAFAPWVVRLAAIYLAPRVDGKPG
ncbi:MAG: NnrS family protein [Kofleriaceae bacterium]|nr:NnrS family protein [Myxococcales bacterium]MCB9564426.1 NnrS family protein [Kofleriaceae bacterium]MCB9573069.1 NnrS family protein [Kofleriaceae bacterium]